MKKIYSLYITEKQLEILNNLILKEIEKTEEEIQKKFNQNTLDKNINLLELEYILKRFINIIFIIFTNCDKYIFHCKIKRFLVLLLVLLDRFLQPLQYRHI